VRLEKSFQLRRENEVTSAPVKRGGSGFTGGKRFNSKKRRETGCILLHQGKGRDRNSGGPSRPEEGRGIKRLKGETSPALQGEQDVKGKKQLCHLFRCPPGDSQVADGETGNTSQDVARKKGLSGKKTGGRTWRVAAYAQRGRRQNRGKIAGKGGYYKPNSEEKRSLKRKTKNEKKKRGSFDMVSKKGEKGGVKPGVISRNGGKRAQRKKEGTRFSVLKKGRGVENFRKPTSSSTVRGEQQEKKRLIGRMNRESEKERGLCVTREKRV